MKAVVKKALTMTVSLKSQAHNEPHAYMKRAVLSVMGFNITYLCANEEIYDALNKIYAPPRSCEFDTGIVVTLNASSVPEQDLDYPPVFEVNQETFRAKSGATFFLADRKEMAGEAYICQRMLKETYTFRHQVLNAISYYLLGAELATPIHCCGFILNKKKFLCLGRSGAGKSTLAMSAYLRGLPVISEDICFIVSAPGLFLVHDCREIHLLPDSVEMFPQLKEYQISRAHNGKVKYIVPLNQRSSENEPDELVILFVNRSTDQDGSKVIERQSREMFDDLYRVSESGFNLCVNHRENRIDRLRSYPSYKASIGRDINSFYDVISSI